MARYAFVGSHDEFPSVRDALDAAGVVLLSISTDDGVIHVSTESAIPEPPLVLMPLED